MRIEYLVRFNIPQEFIEELRKEKIEYLYPPQEEAIKKDLLTKERNFLLAFPTASGKTLIATLVAIKTLLERRGKVIYIVPLVALANEKYAYYKNFFSNFKVALSVGDMDSPETWLANFDFIIVTTEKLDSLIRHGGDWIFQVSLIIIDEIHLLNDYSRGPTLEIVITQLRRLCPQARILALSATVSNAEEISEWLNAELVKSDFRPVRLFEGIILEFLLEFKGKKGYILNEGLSVEEAILEDTLKRKKQVLFFVANRRNAESLAERLGKITQGFLLKEEKDSLSRLSKEIISILETPTHQCRKLAKCIELGSSFHHAGLLNKQRKIIEDTFRQGLIKVVVATPTLALGVNLPCFRVVVRDVKRYYPGLGSEYIPILEYKQFIGRAGRPQYDEFGEAVLIARSEREKEELKERYIEGEPEGIDSKLAQEGVLRMHILSLISSDFCSSLEELEDFFSKTFFNFQYRDVLLLREKIESVLEKLNAWGFVYKQDRFFKSTKLGKRISQLYLDPLTAYNFKIFLERLGKRKEVSDLVFLVNISLANEMSPPLILREEDFSQLNKFLVEEIFLDKVPSIWENGYEDFLSAVKLALVFEAWINEKDEEFILDKFQLPPGEFYAKREIADWLIYSLGEIASLLKLKSLNSTIERLRIRLYYGVKEELLELVILKEIGRKRARRLFNAGFKNISLLRRAKEKELIKILGPRIANIVREQIFSSLKEKKYYN